MVSMTPLNFIAYQWAPLQAPLYVDLTGKTVVIIGANVGIGFEVAKHFARMKPARLILGCRSEERGQTAAKEIARATNYVVEIHLVDLAEFSSVVSFAEGLKDTPVDILVANAAVQVFRPDHARTKDNWEEMLEVNYLSAALVSLLLVPNLVRAGKEKHTTSRLVTTSSGLHAEVPIDELASSPNVLKMLNDPESCTTQDLLTRYNDTKLFNVLFTRALAERLPISTPLVPSVVCPGYCVSELRRSVSWRAYLPMKLLDFILGRSAEKGSRNLLWAALGPDGKEGPHLRYMRGGYVMNTGLHEPGDNVMSKAGYELQEKLWRETVDVLTEIDPTVRSIVSEYLL